MMIHSLYLSGAEISVIAVSLTAAIAAIATPIAIWWRKTKKKVANALNIDENANKEVEDELVIHEDESDVTATEAEVSASEEN